MKHSHPRLTFGGTPTRNVACTFSKTYADDIGVLATEENCDVIVDDIGYIDQ